MTDALHEQAHARTDEKLDQIDQKLTEIVVTLAELNLQAGVGRWFAVTAIPAAVSIVMTIVVAVVLRKVFGI